MERVVSAEVMFAVKIPMIMTPNRIQMIEKIRAIIDFGALSPYLKQKETTVNIDPMQKWLPLNYSFVRIQNSLTNLVRNNKFFTIFVSKTRLLRLI